MCGNISHQVRALKEKLIFKSLEVASFCESMHSTCAQLLSCVQFFMTPWIVVHQAPLSMEFSRQEYWSGYSLPHRILLTQGSNLGLPHCRQSLYCLSNQGSTVYTNIYSSFLHNSPKLETTQMFFNRYTIKRTVIRLYNGIE